MAIDRLHWVGLMEREYLASFIPDGGAAVRFAVGDPPTLEDAAAGLTAAAAAAGLVVLPVSVAATKLHMLQHFFFALAAGLDWPALLQARAEALLTAGRYVWPRHGERMSLAELADANAISAQLLRRELAQWLTSQVWHDAAMAQDFRNAMIALLRDEVTGDDFALREAVLGWLKGDLRRIATVKPAMIGSRIGRDNARAMLVSLCHFLRGCAVPGVLVLLDIRRLHQSGRGEGVGYSPASVMDCYEVLRQVIDDAEHFPGLFLAVLAGEELLEDSRRGLAAYDALRMRLVEDVRLREDGRPRDNPMAPLVRIAR